MRAMHGASSSQSYRIAIAEFKFNLHTYIHIKYVHKYLHLLRSFKKKILEGSIEKLE